MCKKSPIMETGVGISEFETIAISTYNQINHTNICRFDDIVLSNLAKDCNDNAMACPDQYIAIIKVVKGKVVEFCPCFDFTVKDNRANNSKIISKMKHIPVMAIILESPHQKEFDNKHAIGPAMGATCGNFRFYFEEMLEAAIANNQCELVHLRYRIVFINPIQYQCSLGEDTDKYRNNIFSGMWKQVNVRQDFTDRLFSHKPRVVINCCTYTYKDQVKNEIKSEIQKENRNEDITFLKSTHPSSWNDKKNRHITKVE